MAFWKLFSLSITNKRVSLSLHIFADFFFCLSACCFTEDPQNNDGDIKVQSSANTSGVGWLHAKERYILWRWRAFVFWRIFSSLLCAPNIQQVTLLCCFCFLGVFLVTFQSIHMESFFVIILLACLVPFTNESHEFLWYFSTKMA